MRKLEQILQKHVELVERGPESVPVSEVKAMITDINGLASETNDLELREQLRSILDFWVSQHNNRPGVRPITGVHLLPYSKVENRTDKLIAQVRNLIPRMANFTPLLIILGLVLFIVYDTRVLPLIPTTTPVVTVTSDQQASQASTPRPAVVESTPTVTGINVSISSPGEGEEVFPDVTVRGSYQNLQGNWTIHIIAQPISGDNLFYPAEAFYTVPEGHPSGDWSLSISLDAAVAEELSAQINLFAIAVVDGQTRNTLIEASKVGLRDLPEGALTFAQVVTVQKGGYRFVNEPRLLFSFHNGEQNDIATTDLEGNDLILLTDTEDLGEFFPRLSPDGRQIIYVEVDTSAITPVRRLVLMSSNGVGRQVLVKIEGDHRITHPNWSPDGTLIAYNLAGGGFHGLYIYSLLEDVILDENPYRIPIDTSLVRPSWLSNDEVLVANQIASGGTTTWGLSAISIETPFTERIVYDSEYEEESPAVSPFDPDQIVFSVRYPNDPDRNKQQDLYLFDSSTGQAEILVEGFGLTDTVWGPDGASIFFQNLGSGSNTIWFLNLDTKGQTEIVDSRFVPSYPDVGVMDTFFRIPE